MSEAKHSTLPWSRSKTKEPSDTTYDVRPYIEDGAGVVIAKTYRSAMRDGTIVNIPGEDNAAFIVRAVNAHDDLVAAVRATLEMVDRDGGPPDWDFLRAALAKAEAA